MNTRPFGPGSPHACVVCDMLQADGDPAFAWVTGFAVGAGGAATRGFFCTHHATLLATALSRVGIPPEAHIRMNLASDRSMS